MTDLRPTALALVVAWGAITLHDFIWRAPAPVDPISKTVTLIKQPMPPQVSVEGGEANEVAICDQVVPILLAGTHLLEIERAAALVERLNCAIGRRVKDLSSTIGVLNDLERGPWSHPDDSLWGHEDITPHIATPLAVQACGTQCGNFHELNRHFDMPRSHD